MAHGNKFLAIKVRHIEKVDFQLSVKQCKTKIFITWCSSGVVTKYNEKYLYTKKSRYIIVTNNEIQRDIGNLRPGRDSNPRPTA